tara:strand:- start:835 stop:1371 length:537 start_codon:yes stop_codon:yes gene_type:complete
MASILANAFDRHRDAELVRYILLEQPLAQVFGQPLTEVLGAAPTTATIAGEAEDSYAWTYMPQVLAPSELPKEEDAYVIDIAMVSAKVEKRTDAIKRTYACKYCGLRKEAAIASADGRVRIRCPCGGKHADGKTRMHANWKEDDSDAALLPENSVQGVEVSEVELDEFDCIIGIEVDS